MSETLGKADRGGGRSGSLGLWHSSGSLRSWAARWSVVYLAALELTQTSFSALFRLSHHPGITGAALPRLILITPQSVDPLLDGMAKSGLVAREQPGMGRPIHTTPTKTGRERLAQAIPLFAGMDAELVARLPPDVPNQLAALLHDIAEQPWPS